MTVNKYFTIEPGAWPLLSRKTFPFDARPKQVGDSVWSFMDYGYNHALVYFAIAAFAILTIFVVDWLPDNNWGDPQNPVAIAYILAFLGTTLLAYCAFAALISTTAKVYSDDDKVVYEHLLFGMLSIKSTSWDCEQLTFDVCDIDLAFTRTGKFRGRAYGVFINPGKSAPVKLIACYKTDDLAMQSAMQLSEIFHASVTRRECEDVIRGRLSR